MARNKNSEEIISSAYIDYGSLRLCGFTFRELVALRADLYEAAILKTWDGEYSGKARQCLRRILQLTEE